MEKKVIFTILGAKNIGFDDSAPALELLVNPSTWNINFKKRAKRYKTRRAWIEEYWGDEITEITAEGTTGGFSLHPLVHPEAERRRRDQVLAGLFSRRGVRGPQDASEFGFVREAAADRDTEAYQRFRDLLALYKNNGALYDKEGAIIRSDERVKPPQESRGSLLMSFRGGLFEGYFSEFNYTEDVAANPFLFNIGFTFKALKVRVQGA